MTKVLGVSSTGTAAGSLTDGRLTALAGAQPFVNVLPSVSGASGTTPPSLTIAGNTISWDWPNTANPAYRSGADFIFGFWVQA